MHLSVYLISDVPGETAADIQQTIELVRTIQPDDGYVSPLVYYPGTRLYKNALAAGKITADIFIQSQKTALYAETTRGSGSAVILKELSKRRQQDPEHFMRQKQLLGYCYTTNVIAAEFYRQRGEYVKAESELLEISTLQPNNPWGWFLLGDLYSEMGKNKKGRECYAEVLSRVPLHIASKAALKAR